MCGIVGYIGPRNAKEVLLEGLKKLEYRGYDSAGIAILNNEGIFVAKEKGKVSLLEQLLEKNHNGYTIGIAHTRWATHGEPSKANAHPHTDCTGDIAVVHNGIIENFISLKKYLEQKGHIFKSDTDSEIFAHLIEEIYNGDLLEAVRMSVKGLEGSYAFAVVHKKQPGQIICAKRGSPLIIGIGKDETIVASDIAAVLKYTRDVIYVDEEEIVEITAGNYNFYSYDKTKLSKKMEKIMMDFNIESAIELKKQDPGVITWEF